MKALFRCLFRVTLEHCNRRQASIAALRALAPNSLGAQGLIAEDTELEQLARTLRRHAPKNEKKEEKEKETGAEKEKIRKTGTTYSLAEPLRSICAGMLGGQSAGKIIRRLRLARAPQVPFLFFEALRSQRAWQKLIRRL